MNDLRDKLSSEAIKMNNDGEFGVRNFLRDVRDEIARRGSGLFVIEQVRSDSERFFWNCSTEHGCGWHSGHPKQAFSKSELSREIFEMIDRGFFCAVTIRELII